MAKDKKVGIKNTPLELFLLELSVSKTLRTKYSAASKAKKRALLAAKPFLIGDNTIAALLSQDPGIVRARLAFSDQQGTPFAKAGAAKGKGRGKPSTGSRKR